MRRKCTDTNRFWSCFHFSCRGKLTKTNINIYSPLLFPCVQRDFTVRRLWYRLTCLAYRGTKEVHTMLCLADCKRLVSFCLKEFTKEVTNGLKRFNICLFGLSSHMSPCPGSDVFLLPARRQGSIHQQPRREAQDPAAPLPAATTRQWGRKTLIVTACVRIAEKLGKVDKSCIWYIKNQATVTPPLHDNSICGPYLLLVPNIFGFVFHFVAILQHVKEAWDMGHNTSPTVQTEKEKKGANCYPELWISNLWPQMCNQTILFRELGILQMCRSWSLSNQLVSVVF